MGKPEGAVENHLIKRCKQLGLLHYKFVSPSRRGVPDQIVIGNGRVVFVELKSEVGTLSKLQELTIARMRDVGADVRVCYSKAQVDEVMDDICGVASG